MLSSIKNKLKQNKKFYHTYLDIRYGWKMLLKRSIWNYKFYFSKNRGGGIKCECVVSLTSFPKRIKYVKYTIFSLLAQTYVPQKIILWLAKEQFPQQKIPKILQKLEKQTNKRFEVKWCEDIKSYKKLIPSLIAFSNLPIITADDDVYYHPQWLEFLWLSYQKAQDCIHAHMVTETQIESYSAWKTLCKNSLLNKKSSLRYLSIGVGGVLYPPHCLHNDIFNINNFQKLAPLGDDLYFWAMAVLKGTKTKLIDNSLGHPKQTLNFWDGPNLYEVNCNENYNDVQFANILEHYPEIKNIF